MLQPTNNVSLAGDLTSKTLHRASNLVDLRETNNAFKSKQISGHRLDLKVLVRADLPGNFA